MPCTCASLRIICAWKRVRDQWFQWLGKKNRQRNKFKADVIEAMQKNLTLKTLAIVAILIVFVYGIFGIPKGFSGDALKESLLSRISLGLDLKGGTHMILQVMVKDAVKAESDRAAELLREELRTAQVAFGDVSVADEKNHPEQVVVKGVSPDLAGKLRETANE